MTATAHCLLWEVGRQVQYVDLRSFSCSLEYANATSFRFHVLHLQGGHMNDSCAQSYTIWSVLLDKNFYNDKGTH